MLRPQALSTSGSLASRPGRLKSAWIRGYWLTRFFDYSSRGHYSLDSWPIITANIANINFIANQFFRTKSAWEQGQRGCSCCSTAPYKGEWESYFSIIRSQSTSSALDRKAKIAKMQLTPSSCTRVLALLAVLLLLSINAVAPQQCNLKCSDKMNHSATSLYAMKLHENYYSPLNNLNIDGELLLLHVYTLIMSAA